MVGIKLICTQQVQKRHKEKNDGVEVTELSIFSLHPANNFPFVLGYGDVS